MPVFHDFSQKDDVAEKSAGSHDNDERIYHCDDYLLFENMHLTMQLDK